MDEEVGGSQLGAKERKSRGEGQTVLSRWKGCWKKVHPRLPDFLRNLRGMGLAFGLLIVFEVFGSKIELAGHDQLVQGFLVILY